MIRRLCVVAQKDYPKFKLDFPGEYRIKRKVKHKKYEREKRKGYKLENEQEVKENGFAIS